MQPTTNRTALPGLLQDGVFRKKALDEGYILHFRGADGHDSYHTITFANQPKIFDFLLDFTCGKNFSEIDLGSLPKGQADEWAAAHPTIFFDQAHNATIRRLRMQPANVYAIRGLDELAMDILRRKDNLNDVDCDTLRVLSIGDQRDVFASLKKDGIPPDWLLQSLALAFDILEE